MMIRILITLAASALILSGCAGPQSLLGSQPMQFFCPNLQPYMASYDHRMFAELQQDAFPAPEQQAEQDKRAQGQTTAEMASLKSLSAAAADGGKLLLLSGGGQWGAFGAGFLAAQDPDKRDWNVVTGISTGAIQALFVGANQYARMAEQYGVPGENPASANGFRLLTKGSENDLSNLRRLLQNELYGRGNDSLLTAIAKNVGGPEVLIGMVEGRSSDLMVVRLSAYIRANLDPVGNDGNLTRQQVGDCVTGLTLASSAIPLRLTPIQIDVSPNDQPTGTYRTYMDGGVRSSVIDQQAFDTMEAAYAVSLCKAAGLVTTGCTREKLAAMPNKSAMMEVIPPSLFAVRNGPTIVPRGDWVEDAIDDDPDAYVTALRGYSILVNQNELASLAELKARYPTVRLNFISADGYNWMTRGPIEGREVCGDRDPKVYFDPKFMRCLTEFGQWRRSNINPETDGWRQFAPLVPPKLVGDELTLPGADAFDRARSLLAAPAAP